MLYHLLIAVAGVVGLFALWLGIQTVARRQARQQPRAAGECDGPDTTVCSLCTPERSGHCHMKTVEPDTEQVRW